MVRGQYKDKTYFDEFIDFELGVIQDFRANLEEDLSSDPEKQERLKRAVFTSSLRTVLAMYSRGDDVSEIRRFFNEIVMDSFFLGWRSDVEEPGTIFRLDGYYKLTWILSLAIIFDLDEKKFGGIVEFVDETGKTDFFLDSLIAYKLKGRRIREELHFPKNFSKFKDVLESTDKVGATRILQDYLAKNWYKSLVGTFWHDNHKSKHDSYFGYWALEAAAIIKIKELDDTGLKQISYYPYDLLHH